mmetsp:Transcript_81108/g.216658  ORF Transcript_81108/g.216658 Transcript_81108/m.216658 type:complete len:177 (+) Transcript_81108:134-664(+)
MKLIQSVKRRMGNESDKTKGARPAADPAPKAGAASKAGPADASRARRAGGDDNPFGMPTLRESPVTERPQLFQRKLQACSIVYDFNATTHVKEKEAKRQTLLEIVEYVNNTRNCFNEGMMQDVVAMVSANIFRTLPPVHKNPNALFDNEEDEPPLEIAWPHLQIVYEFFFAVCCLQ